MLVQKEEKNIFQSLKLSKNLQILNPPSIFWEAVEIVILFLKHLKIKEKLKVENLGNEESLIWKSKSDDTFRQGLNQDSLSIEIYCSYVQIDSQSSVALQKL